MLHSFFCCVNYIEMISLLHILKEIQNGWRICCWFMFSFICFSWKILALLSYWSVFSLICLQFHTVMEKAVAPHSSTLAWKIPWMEEPGRLQSMGSLRVRRDWVTSLLLFMLIGPLHGIFFQETCLHMDTREQVLGYTFQYTLLVS